MMTFRRQPLSEKKILDFYRPQPIGVPPPRQKKGKNH